MDAVEEVKNRLSIEDVIGEYVQLKRAGRNFRGLSPFNSEKTPSFMVSPEKQIWHDFSSNKGGNMFSFIMEMEGVDFKGALEILARKAGVDLEQYRPSAGKHRGPDKERLFAALDAAARFYQVQLAANNDVKSYVFSERQLTKQTVLEWRLGYSPNTGSALGDFLKKRGFSEAEMRQAGLIVQRNARVTDMFRGRLMIPLQDPQGRVIGFTARQLPGDNFGPKYINTPQSVLYDKSRHVFGLHLAKTAIRETNFAVIVEGNLDVISSHQAGVKQTVATAGTALTESHLKALTRFTGDIRLSFDADKAGINATDRAIGIASRLHVSLNIIDIPNGKDPDELIKKDPVLWQAAVNDCMYALDWLIERQKSMFDLSSAEGKRHFTDAVLPTIKNLDDEVEKDHYLNLIAKIVGVGRQALDAKLSKAKIDGQPTMALRKPKVDLAIEPSDKIEIAKSEDHLLCLALMQPELRQYLNPLEPEMLTRQVSKQLFELIKSDPSIELDKLSRSENIADYVKIEQLQFEELYQGLELSELKYEAARLQARIIEHYVKQQKLNIARQLANADESTTEDLLNAARRLDELLRLNLGDNANG